MDKIEIKYRGKVEGSWWYVTPESDKWQQFWVLADPETIGHFTGETDSDKEDIYEDDILRFNANGVVVGTGERITHEDFVMKWDKDDCMFLPKNLEDNGWYCRGSSTTWTAYQKWKIGNIHDNPELIKQGITN